MTAFPSGVSNNVNTSNLDSATDQPKNARADLLTLTQRVNQMINSFNANSGICGLDSQGKVDSAKLIGQIDTAQLATSAVTKANLASDALASAYPIGSIYMNASDATNPSTLLGFGIWVAFGAGRVLVGVDGNQSEFNQLGETGGAKSVTLTANQSGLRSHRHRIWASQSSGDANQDVTEGGIMGSNDNPQRYVNTNDDGDYLVESTGGWNATQSHTNLQPYIVVYMWKRTD
jgi:hypothetical protein